MRKTVAVVFRPDTWDNSSEYSELVENYHKHGAKAYAYFCPSNITLNEGDLVPVKVKNVFKVVAVVELQARAAHLAEMKELTELAGDDTDAKAMLEEIQHIDRSIF